MEELKLTIIKKHACVRLRVGLQVKAREQGGGLYMQTLLRNLFIQPHLIQLRHIEHCTDEPLNYCIGGSNTPDIRE